jgi:hypothetical protein
MVSPIQKTKTGLQVGPLEKAKRDDNCKIPAQGIISLKKTEPIQGPFILNCAALPFLGAPENSRAGVEL